LSKITDSVPVVATIIFIEIFFWEWGMEMDLTWGWYRVKVMAENRDGKSYSPLSQSCLSITGRPECVGTVNAHL